MIGPYPGKKHETEFRHSEIVNLERFPDKDIFWTDLRSLKDKSLGYKSIFGEFGSKISKAPKSTLFWMKSTTGMIKMKNYNPANFHGYDN
jgi:hypothetical protein